MAANKSVWVVTDISGEIIPSIFEPDKTSYLTKAEAIADIRYGRLDKRPKPKVKRIRKGLYLYTPISVDTGKVSDYFYIKHVDESTLID